MRSTATSSITGLFGLLLTILLLTSVIQFNGFQPQLDNSDEMEQAGARQPLEVDCSNYTFEELFIYDHGLFNLEINNDWQSGWLEGTAWVNDSRSSELRTNLDELLDGLPGGNNSWLSTDEREAVREVGPDCVGDMTTRMGIREGVAHRGGVDWNDIEWNADGIKLDEIDLVPTGHTQERNCQNAFASPDCKEVPVSVTDDLVIFLQRDASEEDHSVAFNKLPNNGNSNFTYAINTSNMTSATISVTFPPVDGLRILAWDLMEDGVVVETSTPPVETIVGGALTVTWENSYDLADWPMIQELFIDFTTSGPETNDPPTWTTSAPTNDTLIPIMVGVGETQMLDADAMATFAVDDGPITISCEGPSGWTFTESSQGDLMVSPGQGSSSATVTCAAMDRFGLTSEENRTWVLAQPISLSATSGEYTDSVSITATASGDAGPASLTLTPIQSGKTGTSASHDNLEDSAPATMVAGLNGLSPGAFSVELFATANGMLDWTASFDLGLSKASTPPTISLSLTLSGENGSWDSSGYSYTMSGTFNEPDGEDVSFSVEVCGYTSTAVDQMGSNWDSTVSVAGCSDHSKYDINITATDASGTSASLLVEALPPSGDETVGGGGGGGGANSEGGGLPFPGIGITLIGLAFAALTFRRRQ